MSPSEPILTVTELAKSYPGRRSPSDVLKRRAGQTLVALDGVSLELRPREVIGVVGESGSGKSTLARCLVRLEEPDAGRVTFRDIDVRTVNGRELASVRRAMQLIYQDPYSSLNPLISVGKAVSEAATVHARVPENQSPDAYTAGILEMVGLPKSYLSRRPSQLSGGERQRVAIARAMAVQPEVLIADEPVSALDVSIQAQVLGLLSDLRARQGVAIIFIAHQLSVVAHIADRVLVMYLGRVVESGPAAKVFSEPAHPYTVALLDSQPGRHRRARRRQPALKGEIPSPMNIPSGCRFRTRCPMAQDICKEVDPAPMSLDSGHQSWCHFADQVIPPAGDERTNVGATAS